MTSPLCENQVTALASQALSARDLSYSPYSKFRVGCALLLENGEVVVGANVENASYGAAICAERTAITRAVMQGHRRFRALAIASDQQDPISPCGICRQFIREFGTEIQVIMVSAAGTTVSRTLGELLPMSFGPDNLL